VATIVTTGKAVGNPSVSMNSAKENVENVLLGVMPSQTKIPQLACVNVTKAGSTPTALNNVLAHVDIQEISTTTALLFPFKTQTSYVTLHLVAVVSLDVSVKTTILLESSTFKEIASLYPIQVWTSQNVHATVLIPPRLVSSVIKK